MHTVDLMEPDSRYGVPLRLTLRPGEKLFINGAVVVNGDGRTDLTLLNEVSILREKDIMTEESANSPCKRVYFLLQLMYIDPPNRADYLENLRQSVAEIGRAVRSAVPLLDEIAGQVAQGDYYQAMKHAKKLISYEKELLEHAGQSD